MAYVTTSQSVDLGDDWVSADITRTSDGDRLQMHLGAGFGLGMITSREEWLMVKNKADKAWEEHDRKAIITARVEAELEREASATGQEETKAEQMFILWWYGEADILGPRDLRGADIVSDMRKTLWKAFLAGWKAHVDHAEAKKQVEAETEAGRDAVNWPVAR